MSVRNRLRAAVMVCTALALAPGSVQAQDVVVTGPPSTIRALLEAFVKGLNGTNADAWEAMAQARFSPELLIKRPAPERRKMYEQLRADFGTFTVERVIRQGPDAPLELHVKGSTGLAGVITLDLSNTDPPRIASLGVDVGNKGGEPEAAGPPPPPIAATMTDQEISRALDTYLSALAADDTFSGVALVAKNGAPLFEKAYGFADRGNQVRSTPRTRFNIGSINKTFTRMAVDQLVVAKKLALTDTLGSFFPDYPQELSRAATVAQLLNHTAGLADFFGPEFSQASKDRFRSNADFFRLVGSLKPMFAPGSRNQYCNGCYIALGAIIERVSGMPYERYVGEHIFTPAGMSSTGYPQVDGIEPNVAMGYTRRGADATLRSNIFLHGATGSAAGGGYSTAADLLAFLTAQRDGRLPRDSGMMQVAGGAPGTSATLEAEGIWTVIVLTNLDPPTGERIGGAIMSRLASAR